MAAEARGGTEGSRKELGLVMAQRVAMFGRCMEAKQLHGEPGVSDEEGGENLEERVGLQSPGKSRRACEGEIVSHQRPIWKQVVLVGASVQWEQGSCVSNREGGSWSEEGPGSPSTVGHPALRSWIQVFPQDP